MDPSLVIDWWYTARFKSLSIISCNYVQSKENKIYYWLSAEEEHQYQDKTCIGHHFVLIRGVDVITLDNLNSSKSKFVPEFQNLEYAKWKFVIKRKQNLKAFKEELEDSQLRFDDEVYVERDHYRIPIEDK